MDGLLDFLNGGWVSKGFSNWMERDGLKGGTWHSSGGSRSSSLGSDEPPYHLLAMNLQTNIPALGVSGEQLATSG